jgi:hypothetical protein
MFVSHHTLARRRTLPRAAAPWACDSGGFTQLDTHGAFRTAPEVYVAAVHRYRDEIGRLQWAAYAYPDSVHGRAGGRAACPSIRRRACGRTTARTGSGSSRR